MAPTLGGVHKIQILIRDLLKEFLQQIFGEEMGGSGGPRSPYENYSFLIFFLGFSYIVLGFSTIFLRFV